MSFAKPLRVDGRFANPWPTREPEAIPGEAPPSTSPEQGDFRRFLQWRFGPERRARLREGPGRGWEPPRATPKAAGRRVTYAAAC